MHPTLATLARVERRDVAQTTEFLPNNHLGSFGAIWQSAVVREVTDIVETVIAEFEQLHVRLRREVDGLDNAVLAWLPGPEMNSISTIVIHLLGSEAELLRLASGVSAARNRDAEFTTPPEGSGSLIDRITEADRLLEEVAPALHQADLFATFVRPSAVRNREPRPTLFWLLNGYGHGREHLAQIQMTRQMYDSWVQGSK